MGACPGLLSSCNWLDEMTRTSFLFSSRLQLENIRRDILSPARFLKLKFRATWKMGGGMHAPLQQGFECIH
jgi:hypothetical protein